LEYHNTLIVGMTEKENQ